VDKYFCKASSSSAASHATPQIKLDTTKRKISVNSDLNIQDENGYLAETVEVDLSENEALTRTPTRERHLVSRFVKTTKRKRLRSPVLSSDDEDGNLLSEMQISNVSQIEEALSVESVEASKVVSSKTSDSSSNQGGGLPCEESHSHVLPSNEDHGDNSNKCAPNTEANFQ